MAGTIYSGVYLNGIVLDNPATQLPATVTGRVSNKNADAIYGKPGARWTVANRGTIENTGSAGFGIDLAAGGTVSNGDSGAAATLIAGYGGVVIRRKAGTVSNFATIEATGSRRDGVDLKMGGRVTNGNADVTAARISGGRHAVVIRNATGAVTNFGTLQNTGTYGVVDLFAGGRVTNGSSTSTTALIKGSANGVYVSHAAGTVTNFGTIEAGWGISLRAGGSVTNGSASATRALIDAVNKGVVIAGAAGVVTNFGTISGSSGVVLRAGGSVTNGSASATNALINGVQEGVVIRGTAGTVRNFGTIISNGNKFSSVALIMASAAGTVANFGSILSSAHGVAIQGGSLMNGSTASTTALISGGYYGVYTTHGSMVTNFGTIRGDEVGVVMNNPGGRITNFGSIYGHAGGVLIFGGGEVDNGSSGDTTALIRGGNGWSAVEISGSHAGVTNFGTIHGSAFGQGVSIHSTAGAITNFGTIETTGFAGTGVESTKGGSVSVTNGSSSNTTALIRGDLGVKIDGIGTVSNFGRISGEGGDAIIMYEGTIRNFGTIGSTSGDAIYLHGGTVINAGTVGGSVGRIALEIRSVGKVVVERGGVFIGEVLGAGKSEIDFKTTGTADMNGVRAFVTIGLGSGESHSLVLADDNFVGVPGPITVTDGNSGNTVNGAALAASHAIVVHAGSGLDRVTGGAAPDLFYAGGDTVMTGKGGKNEFIFRAPGSNTIADFTVSASNEIVFSNSGFKLGLSGASGTPKALPSDLFVSDSDGHFTNTTERFAYATGTGDLFYSATGSGGDGHLVTHLSGTPPPALGLSDLFYIA